MVCFQILYDVLFGQAGADVNAVTLITNRTALHVAGMRLGDSFFF